MKQFLKITGYLALVIALTSCEQVRRSPGRAFMPDMAYSVAYETYASTERLEKKNVYYSGLPVPGTIARGDMMPYSLKNDSAGYAQSASVVNPLPGLNAKEYLEAARLYMINCGICHGDKLDGNGPLWKNGDGPYIAAPKNLLGDDMKAMAPGTMFHSVTYGKGQMGSYASQLNTKQRWMIIHYIKEKQGKPAGTSPAAAPVSDTTVKK